MEIADSELGKGKSKKSLEYLVVQNCKRVQEKNEGHRMQLKWAFTI